MKRTSDQQPRHGIGLERLVPLVGVLLLLAFPMPAVAYVGPGSGLTAIGAVLALVGGILLAIVGFIWYPIKRLFRGITKERRATVDSE